MRSLAFGVLTLLVGCQDAASHNPGGAVPAQFGEARLAGGQAPKLPAGSFGTSVAGSTAATPLQFTYPDGVVLGGPPSANAAPPSPSAASGAAIPMQFAAPRPTEPHTHSEVGTP